MQKKLSIILLALFFGLVLVFMNSQGFLSGASDFTGNAISPATTFLSNSSTGITGFFSGIFNIGKLQEENAVLSDKVNQLEVEKARLMEVQNENDSLRADLDFVKKTSLTYMPSEVIAYDPSNIRAMITIDKGTKDNVKVGMAVVNEGFLVGRIAEVGDEYSKVMIVTDPSSAIPVSVQGSSTNGLIRGQLGSGLMMEKIPQGDKVDVGDTVITSGLGGEIPRGIIIGQVEELESKENSLFVNARVRPQARLSNILRVLVITK